MQTIIARRNIPIVLFALPFLASVLFAYAWYNTDARLGVGSLEIGVSRKLNGALTSTLETLTFDAKVEGGDGSPRKPTPISQLQTSNPKGGNTMSKINRFEDLNAWQSARELTKNVYAVAKHSPLAKDYGLKDQLQRAAVSIMSNIAEGFERINRQEKLQFLNIARSSCGEVRSLTYVCEDNQCLDLTNVGKLREICAQTGRLISGLMRSLQNSDDRANS